MDKREVIDFFKENRLFDNYEFIHEISPLMIKYIEFISESKDQEDFILLMFALDDNTNLFEFTNVFIENIHCFYFNRNKKMFFEIFLHNIEIIYPHAIQMTRNILAPIIYDDNEARNFLYESLCIVDEPKAKIFREIYLVMIQEDKKFYDDKIMSTLNLSS